MADRAAIRAEAARLTALFTEAGAAWVEADVLLPAETLLDLYGEDIRARAYLTTDPSRGEMVLRPDFTVPVVQAHMEARRDPARYTYAGPVFRKQDDDPARATEFEQVGFEIFDSTDPAGADATVFATLAGALEGLPVRPTCGDIGILTAAVAALRTTDARRAALMRHIWRPRRFKTLLDRFGGRAPVPQSRAALLSMADPMSSAGDWFGLRGRAEVEARIEALRQDAETPAISAEEQALIGAILSLKETAPHVLSALRDMAVDMPALSPAVQRLSARLEALSARGIDVDTLEFEGSFGRTNLEYYDGFVFGFGATADPTLPPVATGGRYDALTAKLGAGRAAPAVGGVVRPDLVLALRGAA